MPTADAAKPRQTDMQTTSERSPFILAPHGLYRELLDRRMSEVKRTVLCISIVSRATALLQCAYWDYPKHCILQAELRLMAREFGRREAFG